MTTSASSMCEQRCGAFATVYAIDPCPGGWGGRYCESCATSLRFTVIDRIAVVCSCLPDTGPDDALRCPVHAEAAQCYIDAYEAERQARA